MEEKGDLCIIIVIVADLDIHAILLSRYDKFLSHSISSVHKILTRYCFREDDQGNSKSPFCPLVCMTAMSLSSPHQVLLGDPSVRSEEQSEADCDESNGGSAFTAAAELGCKASKCLQSRGVCSQGRGQCVCCILRTVGR